MNKRRKIQIYKYRRNGVKKKKKSPEENTAERHSKFIH